ncbi:chemotaxis protein [Gardnerella swidsinskii]|uniref:Chemotaxis protein n=1 Tax=Gardnerella swidsinskii TaxID=2792979 RepID=A0A9X7I8W7_9BIFI|nr:chloride channel protein [Gardnerella swidsinskii]NSX41037.1 chloride channel protein [Gardnerella vaginalis]PMC54666.1 chemotaxis protein [Gardnerella swidsinskii]
MEKRNLQIVGSKKPGKCLSYVFTCLRLSLIAFFVAVMAGVGAILLTLLLHAVQNVMFGFSESALKPSPVGLPIFHYVAVVLIVMSVAAIIWMWLWTKSSNHIVDIAHAVSGQSMPFNTTIIHVCLQIFIVASGASLGREVAPRELAAMLTQKLLRFIRVSEFQTRVLVASAAGAGLAGVYRTPIAGAIMALGLVAIPRFSNESKSSLKRLKWYWLIQKFSIFAIALFISEIASLTTIFVLGDESYYCLPSLDDIHIINTTVLLLAIIVGIACGIVGTLFHKMIHWARSKCAHNYQILYFLPLMGLVTGLVASWNPAIMGNGRALAQYAYNIATSIEIDKNSLVTLLLLFVAKIILTSCTLRAGASGGVLQPSMSSGACVGLIVGFISMNIPFVGSMLSSQPKLLIIAAIFGAASLLTASRKSLWFALFLVAQLVNVPMIMIIPMAVSCAVSRSIAIIPKIFMRK